MAITTNQEYLQKTLGKFDITDDEIDVMLADSSLSGEAALDVLACKNAIYKSMSSILPVANVSEGSFSRSWNMEAVKMWYGSLCTELNKVNVLKPKLRDRSNRW